MFFPSSNSFFVSAAGRRLQKHLQSFLINEHIENLPSILIGPEAPFLTVFEQNRPEIILETQTVPDDALQFPLPANGTTEAVFMAVLNNSIANVCQPLIKEVHRILKPKGLFFLIIKNSSGFWPVHVQNMPELSANLIRKELLDTGFSIKRQQRVLSCPFRGKVFDILDDSFFALKMKVGSFSLFAAEKRPFITQSNELYSSTRITKASVLTSPRT